MNARLLANVTAIAVPLLQLAACGNNRNVMADIENSSIELNWTLLDTTDPASCDAAGADSMQLLLFEEGFPLEKQQVPCEQFTLETFVLPGDYTAEMTLLNSAGNAVSGTKRIETFTVGPSGTRTFSVPFDAGDMVTL